MKYVNCKRLKVNNFTKMKYVSITGDDRISVADLRLPTPAATGIQIQRVARRTSGT